jgi:hypothetical protein
MHLEVFFTRLCGILLKATQSIAKIIIELSTDNGGIPDISTSLPTENALFVQTLPPRPAKLIPSPTLLGYASTSFAQRRKQGNVGKPL